MRVAVALVCLALWAAPTSAAIFECLENGKRIFQDKPCDAASKPLRIQPAAAPTPTPAPARDYRLEGLLLDERQRARDREADKIQRGRQAFLDDCRSMREDRDRESAWLQSISDAVREGARIKIQQIEKRLVENGC